jgi:hypothetical protein
MSKRLLDRSTNDLLILLVAGTVCFTVLATGAAIFLVELVHPESDTSQVVGILSDIVNTLIGLLAGFLAGRTDSAMTKVKALEAERDVAS